MRNSGKALLGPLLQQGGASTYNKFPRWLAPWGVGGEPCSLYGVRVGVCPVVGSEEWLRWFAHPLSGGVCRGHAQYPAFAAGSSKVAVGFLVFVSFVQNLPQLCMHIIFSPVQSLCILLLEERCVQVQKLQHCSKGSQVPACLTFRRNQDPALLMRYWFLTVHPLFLHSLPSLISNCLNLPFGNQGRSRRLNPFSYKLEKGTWKGFCTREGPTGSCSVSFVFIFYVAVKEYSM